MMRRTKRLTLAVLACAAVAAVATVAWAAVGDGGTVRACVSNSQGTWRAIDTDASCRPGETAIDMYSKAGADAAFLGKTAKAADSDKLDGIDSTGFLGATAKAADSDLLDGKDSTDFLGATDKAADSDKLDGIDSTGFLGATAKAADSDKLDGLDSSAFVGGGGSQSAFQLVVNGDFRTTSAGLLSLGCTGNFARIRFRARNPNLVAFEVWRNSDGALSRHQLAAGDDLDTDFVGGLHHITLRSKGPGVIGQFDVYVDADACLANVLLNIAPA